MENDTDTTHTRLRSARQRAGLSQQALGKLLDLDQAAVSRLERGLYRLHSDQIRTLARELRVSSDYLLGLSDDEGGAA